MSTRVFVLAALCAAVLFTGTPARAADTTPAASPTAGRSNRAGRFGRALGPRFQPRLAGGVRHPGDAVIADAEPRAGVWQICGGDRSVRPPAGGRVAAVPVRRRTLSSTTRRGRRRRLEVRERRPDVGPVFDKQGVAAIGAIAIDPTEIKRCGSGRVRSIRATTSVTATACTRRPTAATRGRTSVSRRRGRSRASSSIRAITIT